MEKQEQEERKHIEALDRIQAGAGNFWSRVH